MSTTEYKLSYTAAEIDEKLGKIDTIEEQVNNLSGGNVDVNPSLLGELTRTAIHPCSTIYLDGDTTDMTKENAVMLDIMITDEYGKVFFRGKSETTWQGSGSLQYPNKNLSLKLKDNAGEKAKISVFPDYATHAYHLKCNYFDYSMVRNSVGASLAHDFDDTIFPADAPITVKSIPVTVYLNGVFNGCYTLNYKQDDKLFGMDSEKNPLTHIVYRSGLGAWTIGNFEYRGDADETAEMKAKLQSMMDFAANSDDATFKAEFDNYFDLNNAINYWLYADIGMATDSMINNFTVATWDGQKWYMCWYDLDIIFGACNTGIHPKDPSTDLLSLTYTTSNPIWAKLYRCFYPQICARYWELRKGIANPTALVSRFRTFQSKWGADNIGKERAKWTGRPNKDSDVDSMYAWMTERFAVLDDKYNNKILTGISVTYTGGDVGVGTNVNNLTGVTVVATYDDGSTATVTDYTLSGTIAEGDNTITVSYGGMTDTFTVTGIDVPVTFNVTSGLTYVNSTNPSAVVNKGDSYTATLTAESGYEITSVIVTMGGVDITSDVYADGVINITAVTGHVIITATAKKVKVSLDYTPVKYIASNGTQTLYTGISITENTKVVADYQPIEQSGDMFFGVNNNYRAFAVNGSVYTDTPGGRKQISDAPLINNLYTRHIQEIGNDYMTISSVDGRYDPFTRTGTRYDASKVPSGELLLFGTNKAKLRIYSFTVYEGEEKVLELIPALVNGSAGLYDLVNDNFYTNTVGEDAYRYVGLAPEGDYTQVQYIQTDGTQTFHTGINASDTLRIVADIAPPAATVDKYFGSLGSADNEDIRVLSYNDTVYLDVGESRINTTNTFTTSNFYGHRNVFEVGNNYLKLTSPEGLYEETIVTGTTQPSDNIARNEIIISGNKRGKVYSFAMYDGETKVRDFIPVTVNGWVGLYDLVDGKFYYHDEENGENEYTYG